jgi:gliding motility-associated-like protein
MEFFNRKLTLILFCLAFFATKTQGQCDLEIYDFNPETLDVTMIVHNGYGCNPNDLTDDEIDKFILGITSEELQANNFTCGLGEGQPGWILQNFFPTFILWDDANAYLGPDGILSTGDTLEFNIFTAQLGPVYAEECFTQADSLGYFDDCIELHIWQINCSNVITGEDNGENNCTGEPGYLYPDVNPENNVFDVFCQDPPELLYIDYECDLNCDNTLAWYDAITYFENIGTTPITDFCIEWDIIGFNQEYIECFEGELLPGEDIIIEFGPITSDGGGGVVIRLLEINGEETDITWFQPTSCYQNAVATCIYGCTDPLASNYNSNADWDDGSCIYVSECDGYYLAPNTFTPNNDGVNDGWAVISDPECWKSWEVRIYNRWGGLIWESTIPGEVWIGSVFNGDHYVSDGVYIYTVKGVGWNPSYTFEKTGHITIFR